MWQYLPKRTKSLIYCTRIRKFTNSLRGVPFSVCRRGKIKVTKMDRPGFSIAFLGVSKPAKPMRIQAF